MGDSNLILAIILLLVIAVTVGLLFSSRYRIKILGLLNPEIKLQEPTELRESPITVEKRVAEPSEIKSLPYMMALLFLLAGSFLFLAIAWALTAGILGWASFGAMLVIVGFVVLGIAYLWYQKDIYWIKRKRPYKRVGRLVSNFILSLRRLPWKFWKTKASAASKGL